MQGTDGPIDSYATELTETMALDGYCRKVETPGRTSRQDRLARGFACAGRGEDAIIKPEALVKEGYHAGGWRRLVRHAAYDAIRAQPRFEALVDRLRSVADGERKGFLARPDLAQSDIDPLGEARSR